MTQGELQMALETRNFETLALHGGSHRADSATGAVAVPIYQTTSFQFENTDHASRLFALEQIGPVYTRIGNPTQEAFETRLAALEGGAAALAVASGQTASAFAIFNLTQAGDNIVSATDLYGGTWTLFSQTLKQFGIEVRFVDPSDPDNFRRATDANTRAYYAETLPTRSSMCFRSRRLPTLAAHSACP
jgi:O-acetylhomoserine (thiol)-lyase